MTNLWYVPLICQGREIQLYQPLLFVWGDKLLKRVPCYPLLDSSISSLVVKVPGIRTSYFISCLVYSQYVPGMSIESRERRTMMMTMKERTNRKSEMSKWLSFRNNKNTHKPTEPPLFLQTATKEQERNPRAEHKPILQQFRGC